MTLEELLAKVPPKFQGIAKEYGPALIKMTLDELNAWIILIARGDVAEAYNKVLDQTTAEDLLISWGNIDAEWAAANVESVKRIALQKSAAISILKVLLSIAITLVGL